MKQGLENVQMAIANERTLSGSAPSAADRVHAELRRQIVALERPPGATLSRNKLTQQFGVSQTPVREALQRLEAEGLVTIFPQSRTIVSKIDVQKLFETQFLRVAVETEVVRRLADHPRQDVFRKAGAVLDMQKALLGSDDQMPLFTELDRSFHLTLFEGVGMEPLHAMLQARLGHLYRCQQLELPRTGKMQSIVTAHQAVLDGLTAGHATGAVEAMRTHLSGTISRVGLLQNDFPDYFSGHIADDPDSQSQ